MADSSGENARAMAVYESAAGELRLKVDSEGQTVWATQAQIAALFDCTEQNVDHHIGRIISTGELEESATTKQYLVVRTEGTRQVTRNIAHYNLDMILSVGYRVNTVTATRFRQWATATLKEYITSGYVLNAAKLAADPEALRHLSAEIRKVRLSEQAAYARVRDIFRMSASDYTKDSPAAHSFFATAQDKFHYAVTGKIAAEIVLERADAKKPNMGLLTMSGDQPSREDAIVGKNYLNEHELHYLENISEQFMLFCESQAMRGKKMTMEELSFRLNTLLTANDYPVLYEYGKYRRTAANQHAQKQLRAYQARLKTPKKAPRLKSGKPEGEEPHA